MDEFFPSLSVYCIVIPAVVYHFFFFVEFLDNVYPSFPLLFMTSCISENPILANTFAGNLELFIYTQSASLNVFYSTGVSI